MPLNHLDMLLQLRQFLNFTSCSFLPDIWNQCIIILLSFFEYLCFMSHLNVIQEQMMFTLFFLFWWGNGFFLPLTAFSVQVNWIFYTFLRLMFHVVAVNFFFFFCGIHFQDDAFVWRLEQLCDTVLRLQSFGASKKEKCHVFKDYSGKMPHALCFVSFQQSVSFVYC